MLKKIIVILSLLPAIAFSCEKHIVPEQLSANWVKEEWSGGVTFATLSTVSENNKPSSRVIQLFVSDDNGMQFYTHRNTRKANDISANPSVSLNAWMPNTKRQLEVEGDVLELSSEDLEDTWSKMPRNFQLKFISSDHKSNFTSADQLVNKLNENKEKYQEVIPMPQSFVGYSLVPSRYEFYSLAKDGSFPDKIVAIRDADKWDVNRKEP